MGHNSGINNSELLEAFGPYWGNKCHSCYFNSTSHIEPFIQQEESETRASLKGLNPDLNHDVFNQDFHDFFYFDVMSEPETSSILSVPDAITLTDKFVELGLLDLGPEKTNLSDLDSPGDDTEEIDLNLPPSITTVEASQSKIDNFFKPLASRSTTRTRLQLTSDGQPTATVGLHENSEEVWEAGPLDMVEVGVGGMEKSKEK
ncbi:hypothetical protein HOY82DRAFT_601589 [Tuber indicum]|nr:hypothetical protein HOY82DRAFT_601589 [Tuber indicum]